MNLHFAAGYFADNPYFPAHHANCLVQYASISPHFFGKRRPARRTYSAARSRSRTKK
jgi:hypothetical protein